MRTTWVFRGKKAKEKSSTQIRVFSYSICQKETKVPRVVIKYFCVFSTKKKVLLCVWRCRDTGYYIYQKILHHANVTFQCRTTGPNAVRINFSFCPKTKHGQKQQWMLCLHGFCIGMVSLYLKSGLKSHNVISTQNKCRILTYKKVHSNTRPGGIYLVLEEFF